MASLGDVKSRSLVTYLKFGVFVITWTVIVYGFVSSGFAAQRQDQAINNERFSEIKIWQIDATIARKEMFDKLTEISSSLARIEGRMEKP